MADKQLARSGAADFNVLADDDPLAELARIVGYDNRPAVQQLQELERHREAVSREVAPPELDLEDELLREFDVYDAPQVAPVVQVVEPVRVEEAVAFVPRQEHIPAVEYQAAEIDSPVADMTAPAASVEPVVVEQPVVEQDFPLDVHAPEHAQAQSWRNEPEALASETENGWAVEQWSEPVFDGVDLERELELSIGSEDMQIEASRIETLPVSHVELEQDFAAAAPADVAAPSVLESAVAAEPHGYFEPAQPAAEPEALMQAELPERQDAPAPVSADIVISPSDPHGIDALLADIERFPVPPKAETPAVVPVEAARKVNYPFTPTFSRATPVASNNGASSQKAYATPLAATVAAAPVAAVVAEAAYQRPAATAEPVVVEAAAALKPPVQAEPDFDLDTFELELSDMDINLEIDPSEFEPAAQETAFVAAAPAAVAAVAAAPAIPVAQPPALELPEFAEDVREEEPESVLAFDPSMIAETEESLTAIADLNVPQLPVVEQERPAVHHPDYDLDIDAEMAQLFAAPGSSAQSVDRSTNAAKAVPPAQSSNVRVEEDFDEFEKAMEEDFRRSLSQPQDNDPSSDRLAVGSGYAANTDYDDERRGSGRRRLALLAATVAGLAIFGGVGVYAFMGGSGSALSGGEPKIILADKAPVKMVPVEKGGKTVPNQDKAVYDRVAGAQDTTPQQGTLVSSTEEPIDVVQRTLTPENLPNEGADDELPGVMPADEDGSDRLLPDGQTADNTTADAEQSPAVSPRKVRTMIVKPDGTLVAREEPVAEPQTNVAANNGDPKVNIVKTTTLTKPIETASTPKSQPVVEQLAEQGQKSALAEVAAASVDETAPVRPVKTSAVADAAPVAQAQPAAEQKVVDTFKNDIAATQPAAEDKPVETASIAPGTYVIQIASLPSEAEAQKSYKTLSGKFGNVIGGKGVDIKKAEIAGKGTYYRVRIPAGSRDAANAMCAQYKSAGGSCLVTR